MSYWLILFSLLYALPESSMQQHVDVTVKVRGNSTIAETDDNFVCATIDWWPAEKCNYNQCPWGESSALNLDVNHPLLARAIEAFKTLRIRVGGSLQDQVVYGVKSLQYPCLPFSKTSDGLFGFSRGCLSMVRWDDLHNLFQKTGAIVTFGLNALSGRHHIRNKAWGGAWNSTNARDFIAYTISKQYQIDSWEFGNELSGRGIGARVDATVYGEDLIGLKSLLDELYNNSQSRALLLAPGGFFDPQWYTQFLQVSGPTVVNVVTHHIYNLGKGNDPHLTRKILDPHYLSGVSKTYSDLQHTIQTHGPWSSAWVGEAGGVSNNGGHLVSNTFINSFWYLDQLGMSSKYNTKVYCRQTLIGGNYGLLDTETLKPNPDYYSALLWHRLMGKRVLYIETNASFLRAYAHCSKQKTGISLLLINLSNTTDFRATVSNDINPKFALGDVIQFQEDSSFIKGIKRTMSWIGIKASDMQKREEYHLTAKDGYHRSKTMLLNGNPLELTEDGGIPDLNPSYVSVMSPILVAPMSIAFVVFPNFDAPACVP